MRRILLVTVLVLAALPAATASGAAIHHSANVTIDYEGSGDFSGKVQSSGRCEKSRKVDLLFNGGITWRPLRTFVVVGSDTTNDSGDWSVDTPAAESGDYKAKARRKTYNHGGRKHVCDPATSKKIVFM